MGEEDGSSALTLSHPNLELPPAGTGVRLVRDPGGSGVELSLRTALAPWAGSPPWGPLLSPVDVLSRPSPPREVLAPSRGAFTPPPQGSPVSWGRLTLLTCRVRRPSLPAPSVAVWLQVELSDGTAHTITDAYAGKEYIIQVAAKDNEIGTWSDWSVAAHATSWTEEPRHLTTEAQAPGEPPLAWRRLLSSWDWRVCPRAL